MKISRRHFIKSVVGCVAAAGCYARFWYLNAPRRKPTMRFIDLGSKFRTAIDVAHDFVTSKTPNLMTAYSVFYPEFLLTHKRSEAIKEIKSAISIEKTVYAKDHHRLDALPAVTCAHLLKTTVSDDLRNILCDEINATLSDPRREVREIVLQNLITATYPNPDTLKYFAANQEILKRLECFIDEYEANEKMLTPAVLSTEFLLNARAILLSREANKMDIDPFTKIIDKLTSTDCDHFWYLSRLVELYERSWAAHSFIPPQSSEALMGWRILGDRVRDYLQHLALIRAKLMQNLTRVARGDDPADYFSNRAEARRAIPKLICFFRNHGLNTLIDSQYALSHVPSSDFAFRLFFSKGEYQALCTNPEQVGFTLDDVQADEIELDIAQYVPFAEYSNYATLKKMRDEYEDSLQNYKRKALDAKLTSIGVGLGSYLGSGPLYNLAARILKIGDNQKHNVPTKAKQGALDKADQIAKDVDSGLYQGADEQEEELGDIELD